MYTPELKRNQSSIHNSVWHDFYLVKGYPRKCLRRCWPREAYFFSFSFKDILCVQWVRYWLAEVAWLQEDYSVSFTQFFKDFFNLSLTKDRSLMCQCPFLNSVNIWSRPHAAKSSWIPFICSLIYKRHHICIALKKSPWDAAYYITSHGSH